MFSKPSGISCTGNTPFSAERDPNAGSMEGFGENMVIEGLSQEVTEVLTSCRRSGTLSHYKSAWEKWNGWYIGRKINPISAGVNHVLQFLSDLYQSGLEYRTINCYRSTISAYHIHVDNKPIGQHPMVCKLLSGVFNKRPPQPKYTIIWDVNSVVNYIKRLSSNDELSVKDLTLKLTTLIALTSSGRSSEITYLDTRYRVFKNNSVIFHFSKLTKTWKKGQSPPTFELNSFTGEDKLCVIQCLKRYLVVSKQWRKNPGSDQLLLSHIKPHGPVTVSTVSRWLKQFLGESGIDTSIFTGHSTRSASSSKVKQLGLSISQILDRGQWSNKTTFEKFYNKPIMVDNRPSVFG